MYMYVRNFYRKQKNQREIIFHEITASCNRKDFSRRVETASPLEKRSIKWLLLMVPLTD